MATKGAGQQRSVFMLGHSWVVAVPPRVRQHLKLRPGRPVYWHLTGPREATISPQPSRVGGKPPGLGLEDELIAARRRISRLEGRLREQPARVFHQGKNAGFATAQRLGYVFNDTLVEVRNELRELRAELGMRTPRRPSRARRPRPPATPPVEHVLLLGERPPFPPYPLADFPGGDVASGGDTPQATHE